MTPRQPSTPGLPRLLLLALAGAGLGVLLFWHFDQPAHQPIKVLTQPAPQLASPPRQSVAGAARSNDLHSTHGLTGSAATRQTAAASAGLESRPPPPQLFSFLGKTTQHGRTVILLHCCGRILTVSGTGPLGDGYVVDAIQEDHLVLRHEQLGESQILPLTRQRQAGSPVGSPEDTPQD